MEENKNDIITNGSDELSEEQGERWYRITDMPVDVAITVLEGITASFTELEFMYAHVNTLVDEANKEREGKVSLKVPLFTGIILGLSFFGIVYDWSYSKLLSWAALALCVGICFLPYQWYKKKCAIKANKTMEEARKMQAKANAFRDNDEFCQAGVLVPEGYRNSTKCGYILKCLKDGVATSVRDAIKLCDEEMHRWRMEQRADEQTYLMEQQLNTLEDISVQVDNINRWS